MGTGHNLIEEIADSLLERALLMRFDICTCTLCRNKMKEAVAAKIPPINLDPAEPSYNEVKKEIMRKYFGIIFQEINSAIDNVNKNKPHLVIVDKEKDFEQLLIKIKEDRGLDLKDYYPALLKRRVALRLIANKINSYTEYLKILAGNPLEYRKLFEAITINVSDFFRDPPVWLMINKLLRKIIAEKNFHNESINIWSAGCARGEEPYSLAMLAYEADGIKVPFKIQATDIEKECINFAKEGIYPAAKLDKISRGFLKNCFLLDLNKYFIFKDNTYQLREQLKKMVEFSYLDLTSSPYFNNIDLILCRNVFIYFNKALQEQILDRFYKALGKKGYLVIGENESLPPEAKIVFKEVTLYGRVYQKIDD